MIKLPTEPTGVAVDWAEAAQLRDEFLSRRARVVMLAEHCITPSAASDPRGVTKYDQAVRGERGVGAAYRAYYQAVIDGALVRAFQRTTCPMLTLRRLPDGVDDWNDPTVCYDLDDVSILVSRLFAPALTPTEAATPAQRKQAIRTMLHEHEIAVRCSFGITLETIRTRLTGAAANAKYAFTPASLQRDAAAALAFVERFRDIWSELDNPVDTHIPADSPLRAHPTEVQSRSLWNLLHNKVQRQVDVATALASLFGDAFCSRAHNAVRDPRISAQAEIMRKQAYEEGGAAAASLWDDADALTGIHIYLLQWVREMLRWLSPLWREIQAVMATGSTWTSASIVPKMIPAFVAPNYKHWDSTALTRVQVYLVDLNPEYEALTRGNLGGGSPRSLCVMQDALSYYDAVVLPLRLLGIPWYEAWDRVLRICDDTAPAWAPQVHYADADHFDLPL